MVESRALWCYRAFMTSERAIANEGPEAAADARADADIEAGRVVDHAEVSTWLAKWGTPRETPAPPEWLA